MKEKMINPIIPGYYPDPTICRVGDDYYIACSSMELYPGIPVFHSRDLVHWTQIGNAVDMDNGLHLERGAGMGGVMAPTLRYHKGTYYMINANFCDQGNYIITAKDPAGPWSQIHWLEDVPGIDASLFFDDDDQCYIMGTGNVWDNGTGVKERGIWLALYDIDHFKLASEPVCIFNSGMRGADSPESPHLYHFGDYYYLMIAEGGTEHYHSVVVARSKDIFGFYENNPANPVMTHRHMGYGAAITNVGHADFVELPDGSWYAVMLASRPICGHKNLGRETWICPVVWEDDWPLFSPATGNLAWSYDAPVCLEQVPAVPEQTRDEFDDPQMPLYWTWWGTPYRDYWRIKDSALEIDCIAQPMVEELQGRSFELVKRTDHFAPFIARRQRQPRAEATCAMTFEPRGKEIAGLAFVLSMNHQLRLERALADGQQVVRLTAVSTTFISLPFVPGYKGETKTEVIAQMPWDRPEIVLRIAIDEEDMAISFGSSEKDLKLLCTYDGRLLVPKTIGCLTGTMIGMFATGSGEDTDNRAAFDWFELK